MRIPRKLRRQHFITHAQWEDLSWQVYLNRGWIVVVGIITIFNVPAYNIKVNPNSTSKNEIIHRTF